MIGTLSKLDESYSLQTAANNAGEGNFRDPSGIYFFDEGRKFISYSRSDEKLGEFWSSNPYTTVGIITCRNTINIRNDITPGFDRIENFEIGAGGTAIYFTTWDGGFSDTTVNKRSIQQTYLGVANSIGSIQRTGAAVSFVFNNQTEASGQGLAGLRFSADGTRCWVLDRNGIQHIPGPGIRSLVLSEPWVVGTATTGTPTTGGWATSFYNGNVQGFEWDDKGNTLYQVDDGATAVFQWKNFTRGDENAFNVEYLRSSNYWSYVYNLRYDGQQDHIQARKVFNHTSGNPEVGLTTQRGKDFWMFDDDSTLHHWKLGKWAWDLDERNLNWQGKSYLRGTTHKPTDLSWNKLDWYDNGYTLVARRSSLQFKYRCDPPYETLGVLDVQLSECVGVQTANLGVGSIRRSYKEGATGFTFNDVGDKVYFLDGYQQNLIQVGLNTYYDVSSFKREAVFSTQDQEQRPHSVGFNTDGTKMFIMGGQRHIIKGYTLGTAFEINSATPDGNDFDGRQYARDTERFKFTPDGTRLFICDNVYNNIYGFTLSTPFDLSTVSFASSSPKILGVGTVTSLEWNHDGTRLHVSGSQQYRIANQETTDSIRFSPYNANFTTNAAYNKATVDSYHVGIPWDLNSIVPSKRDNMLEGIAGEIIWNFPDDLVNANRTGMSTITGITYSHDGKYFFGSVHAGNTLMKFSVDEPWKFDKYHRLEDYHAVGSNLTRISYTEPTNDNRLSAGFAKTGLFSQETEAGDNYYFGIGTAFYRSRPVSGNVPTIFTDVNQDHLSIKFVNDGYDMYISNNYHLNYYRLKYPYKIDTPSEVEWRSRWDGQDKHFYRPHFFDNDHPFYPGKIMMNYAGVGVGLWSVGTGFTHKAACHRPDTAVHNQAFLGCGSSISYDKVATGINSSMLTGIGDMAFNNDGDTLYLLDTYQDRLWQYSLDSPYDVSSICGFTTFIFLKDFENVTQDGGIKNFKWVPDGSEIIFFSRDGDELTSYIPFNNWDIRQLTLSKSKELSGIGTFGKKFDMQFSDDGKNFYFLDRFYEDAESAPNWPRVAGNNARVWQRPIATAWDINSIDTSVGIGTSVRMDRTYNTRTDYTGLTWDKNGEWVMLHVRDSTTADTYKLNTPWDLSEGYEIIWSGDSVTTGSGYTNFLHFPMRRPNYKPDNLSEYSSDWETNKYLDGYWEYQFDENIAMVGANFTPLLPYQNRYSMNQPSNYLFQNDQVNYSSYIGYGPKVDTSVFYMIDDGNFYTQASDGRYTYSIDNGRGNIAEGYSLTNWTSNIISAGSSLCMGSQSYAIYDPLGGNKQWVMDSNNQNYQTPGRGDTPEHNVGIFQLEVTDRYNSSYRYSSNKEIRTIENYPD